MKLWRFFIGFAGALVVLIVGCEETFIGPANTNFDYLPMEVGNYIIYDLDSIFYDEFNDTITSRSLLVRESVESIFTDGAGVENFRILREYRNTDSEEWGFAGFDVWSAKYNGSNVERVEENLRYVKLVTPPSIGLSWDGNVYLNIDPDGPLWYLEDWNYRIKTLDEPYTVNSVEYDSTLLIVQKDEGTAIDTVGSREVYAKGIGLIFKEIWVLETQCKDCDPEDIPCITACQQLPWDIKAESGFIVTQRIKSYGQF